MTGDGDDSAAKLGARVEQLLADRAASRSRRIETIAELKQIVTAIDRIAITMKRLAINATIESAHTGDTATGFSVIAGEMKSLANAAQDAVRRAHALLDARDRDQILAEESAQG